MGDYPVGRAVTGEDHTGVMRDAHVHRREGHNFVLTQSEAFLRFNPEFHPFLNETKGNAMNQNVSFGGTPEIIHNGGTSTEWTGSAIAGTWNFADAGKTTITAANNNDEATFAEQTPTTIAPSGFTALTGEINLTIYNETNNDIEIFFDLAGVQVGDTLDLEDFIDTSLIGTAQNFAINLDLFNFASDSVDGFSIRILRTGGARPTIAFDDITLQQTGVPLEYKATTPLGTRFHIDEIRIAMADNETGIVTVAGATENHSMINLGYDKILSVSALSTGIIFKRVQSGNTLFSVTLKQLGDFLSTGSNLINAISDGTNTFLTLLVEFPKPIILDGSSGDFLSFTVNDDLSSLLQFTAAARGALEI